MSSSPLSMTRRHVLGDLCARCDEILEDIPVYDGEHEVLGHVNQSLGHYADAFTFFLDDNTSKRLAAGQFLYSFDYEIVDSSRKDSRIRLNSITLIGRTDYAKPMPRRRV